MRLLGLSAVAAAVGFAGVYGLLLQPGPAALRAAAADCRIKGNVSIDSGERIYHVPGQHYYDATIISPQFGERWFCSEAEARAAGWRKSRI